MSAPTLILISGFARAGKGTLANGILEWSTRPAEHINFADSLKGAANYYLDCLDLEGDFFKDEFKTKHRQFLVSAGMFARSIDKDVFARSFANSVPSMKFTNRMAPETVVCSDWRYLNELHVCRSVLTELGWRIKTVHISTAGVGPANDEELDSIAEIRSEHAFDQEYVFRQSAVDQIMQEGRLIARSWRL